MTNDYVVVDLETTGLDPKRDKIIEIGCARVRGGEITDTYKTFVNPARKLNEKVITLTRIVDEDLEDAPQFGQIKNELMEFLGDDVLLGHSILSDFSFLKREFVNGSLKFERYGVDTLKIARVFLGELPSRNLHKLCEYYDIEHVEHRALNDAIATHQLYQRLVEEFYCDENEKHFEKRQLIYQVKKQGPITKHQIEQLKNLIEVYNVDFPYNIEALTKNDASRFIDIIKANKGNCF